MPRRKQIYKITYPNGKIYVGMDLTGTALYMGSPSAYQQIVTDLEVDPDRFELTLRKEILWESETATPFRRPAIGNPGNEHATAQTEVESRVKPVNESAGRLRPADVG
jgi:hypothetical protein